MVALDAVGAVLAKAGEPDAPHLPRSANKPLQLVGMLRAGLALPPPDLAVAASSHSGEPAHVRRVRDLLAGTGSRRARWPARRRCRSTRRRPRAMLAAGGGPEPRVTMNCSGKHTAMVLTCVANGWPLAGYAEPDHPLQVAIRAAVEDLAGQPVTRGRGGRLRCAAVRAHA